MKGDYFYSHLIEETVIFAPLDKLDLSQTEREELTVIITGNIHHLVLDLVLSELSKEDGKLFLKHVVYKEHDLAWQLLPSKIAGVEEKIRHVILQHVLEVRHEVKKLSDKTGRK